MPTATPPSPRYIATWNEQDAGRRPRAGRADSVGRRDVRRPADVERGPDGIAAMIGAAQGQFPGLLFRRAGGPERHHGRARFSW